MEEEDVDHLMEENEEEKGSNSGEAEEEEEESNDYSNPTPEAEEEGEPKQKRLKSLQEDRISSLPDSIIHHILSLLPMRDAVKTGVLSKRWKISWTSVPNLIFSYVSVENFKPFFQFIDRTLILHSSEKIKNFSLNFNYIDATHEWDIEELDTNVSLWLRFATSRKVEELHISLSIDRFYDEKPSAYELRREQYVMPHFIYENSSLTKFYSRSCVFCPKGLVSWTSLKVLTISEVFLKDDVLQRILLGCPELECLELRSISCISEINTSSNPRLKRLVIYEMRGTYKISIPSVNSLEILGDGYENDGYAETMVELLDISSLVDATLDFGLDYEKEHKIHQYQDMVVHVLEKVNHVNQLTLGSLCIQVLSLLELKGLPSPLSNHERKCLTIVMGFKNWHLYGFASLLNSLPNLEKLIIELTPDNEYYSCYSEELKKLDEEKMKNFWEVKGRSFECLVMSLKTVEIVVKSPFRIHERRRQYYIATEHPGLFEFVEFILKSARVLERMIFVAEKSSGLEARDFYWVAKKVLNLPRASPNAVVSLPD